MPVEPTLTELLESENDADLRVVLSHYLAASKSLEAAAQRLGRTGHKRWQMACVSRSRDIEWQALRYMKIERLRAHKLEDFREDAPTNPRGYPAFTGLSERIDHPALPPLPKGKLLPIPRAPRVPQFSPIDPVVPEPSIVVTELDSEVTNHHEAVFDTDRPPPKKGLQRFVPHERHRQIMDWCFQGAVLLLLAYALWLFKQYGHRLD
jgi:hypothetical protein